MTVLSVFQTLPLHIAEAIAEYYIGTHRFAYLSQSEQDERRGEAWFTLYKVSSIWRALAIRYFYEEVTLRLTLRSIGKGYLFTRLPNGIERKPEWSYNYVRNITIFVECAGYNYDCEIIKYLRSMWNKDTVFPLAQHLTVYLICSSDNIGPLEHLAEECILHRIAQHLPKAVPNLQRGDISIRNVCSCEDAILFSGTSTIKRANTFFPTLFGKVKELDFCVSYATLEDISSVLPQNFQGFTRLSVECKRNADIIYIIVKKSRLVLESLDLGCFEFDDLKPILYDDNSQAVTYPRLRKLKYGTHRYYVPRKPLKTDKPVSFFPALTYLNWLQAYPFSDDTLFRGNSETLGYLKIVLDKNLVNFLEEYKMFSVGRLPKLHCLTVCNPSGSNKGGLDLELFTSLAISLLTPTIRAFKIISKELPQPFAPYIVPSGSIAESIQVLDLGKIELEFVDMLNIIKLLPNMTDICCRPRGMFPALNDKLEDTILDLQTKYYPLSHRLKCWSLVPLFFGISKGIELQSAILAILCTNFTCTAAPPEERKRYYSCLRAVLKQPEFNNYTEKIMPLFREE